MVQRLIISPGIVACVSSLASASTLCEVFSLTIIPVMIAENVSVGILSLPSAVATLGMVPYVLIPAVSHGMAS